MSTTTSIPHDLSGKLGERLLTPSEVAEYLSVPKKTLYAWRYRHSGPPAIKVGRHLRYQAADVLKWLNDQPQDNS